MKQVSIAVLFGIALALLLGFVALMPGPGTERVADAHEDPSGCTGNFLGGSIQPSPRVVQPGDFVTYQLEVENRDGVGATPCAYTNISVNFTALGCPTTKILQIPSLPSGEDRDSTDFPELKQVCQVPPGTPAGFALANLNGSGTLHSGSVDVTGSFSLDEVILIVIPRLIVEKRCLTPLVNVGDNAEWEIVVRNESEPDPTVVSVELRDVVLIDKGTQIEPAFTLLPGESRVFLHSNLKTSEDGEQGFIENTVSATALVVIGDPPTILKEIGPISATDRCFNPTPTPEKPNVVKKPNLANLWLCNTGAVTCDNKESGVQEVNFDVNMDRDIDTRDPKCLATATDPSSCPFQQVGSFEFEVRYDAKLVTVQVHRGPLFDRSDASCETIRREGSVQFRCNLKGKPADAPRGPGTLAVVRVRAMPDVYSLLIANQGNGVATQLINQDCQLSDLQGHPIKLGDPTVADPCDDAAVTVRYLEGDVHADCVVDVHDQQQIAFRWGARLGNLLYNSRFDLEPSAPKKGDGDIDAKDLQSVYGRHGSTCKAPHPPQDPVDPKAKVGPPA